MTTHPYLHHMPNANHAELLNIQEKTLIRLASNKKGIKALRERFEKVAHLQAKYTDFTNDTVTIGKKEELSAKDQKLLYKILREIMPWRKGPFNIFGIDIDAEWRSNRKWQRLKDHLPNLKDKVIADIGCNNGYYMFRMMAEQPKLVVGFEPYLHHYFTFKTLNNMAACPNLHLELLGVEDTALYYQSFDVVFLLGIIYHRISPLSCLKEVKESLVPGGTLIVESQAIPGQEPVALFPEERYAKVPGTYFVPTGLCLKNWLIRAGFEDVTIFHSHPMDNSEQRKTAWMQFESYDDFIDPNNKDLTIEGYPAPIRVFVKAKKPL